MENVERSNPFRMRTHHFAEFGVHSQLSDTERHTVLTFGIMDLANELNSEDVKKRNYARDMLGEQSNSQHLVSKLSRVHKKFIQLPDSSPVDLIIGQHDEACDQCAIGIHCRLRNIEQFNGSSDVLLRENQYLDVILGLAEQLPLNPDEFKIVEDKVIFDDAGEETVRKVETNAGVIRQLFKAAREKYQR